MTDGDLVPHPGFCGFFWLQPFGRAWGPQPSEGDIMFATRTLRLCVKTGTLPCRGFLGASIYGSPEKVGSLYLAFSARAPTLGK